MAHVSNAWSQPVVLWEVVELLRGRAYQKEVWSLGGVLLKRLLGSQTFLPFSLLPSFHEVNRSPQFQTSAIMSVLP